MVDTGPVQSDERHAGAVLDIMNRDSIHPAVHIDTVMIGSDVPCHGWRYCGTSGVPWKLVRSSCP
jgi:hypothetical protein